MATKTISLELDAYEKLRRAKQGGESFSAVVRRARFEERSGSDLRVSEKAAGYGATSLSAEASGEYWDRIEREERTGVALESFEAAVRRQKERNKNWNGSSTRDAEPEVGRGWTREHLYDDRLDRK